MSDIKPTKPCNCREPVPNESGDECVQCFGTDPKVPEKKPKRRKK